MILFFFCKTLLWKNWKVEKCQNYIFDSCSDFILLRLIVIQCYGEWNMTFLSIPGQSQLSRIYSACWLLVEVATWLLTICRGEWLCPWEVSPLYLLYFYVHSWLPSVYFWCFLFYMYAPCVCQYIHCCFHSTFLLFSLCSIALLFIGLI